MTHQQIRAWLPEQLGVRLNDAKTILQPASRGVDFVGQLHKPWRTRTRPSTVHRAVARLQAMDAADIFAAGNSYLGLIRQATHSHHDQARIANALRDRGHAVAGDLNKIYRRST